MVAFGTFLVILALSLVVTRVASIALMQTGLSRDLARFQARSAFSGAGFTTNEAERVVSHPARRKVIGLLILLGNAGLVSAVATLLLGVRREGEPYLGVPDADIQLRPGDTVVLYGQETALARLEQRTSTAQGEARHREGVQREERRRERTGQAATEAERKD
jgi:hypothetical protein